MGWFDGARRALAGDPVGDDARAVKLIDEGNALEERGDGVAARRCYDEALRLAPKLPRAHLTQGNLKMAAGDLDGAIAAYQEALRHDPNYVGGLFNLGNARVRMGDGAAALGPYRRVIQLDPSFTDAHVALGALLEDLGQPHEAIASYHAALALQPTYAQVHSNLGNALRTTGRFESAVDSHRQAVALDPTLASAHNGLGNALKDIGRLEEAEAAYRRALELAPGDLDARSNLLFCHHYRAALPAAELLAEARQYGAAVAARARPYGSWHGAADPDRRLRIGIVSGDLRDHPVGHFFAGVAAALFAVRSEHVSGGAEWSAYVTAPCVDALAQTIRSHLDHWTDVQGLSDEALAARIHDDSIDILIDFSGHTAHTRLPAFAWKPSPVQLSWLGYFATTGVAEVDGFVADASTLPAALEADFVERIIRLPQTRLCFTGPEPSPPVAPLPALTNGFVTFGCFNNLTKLNADVVEVWSRVLRGVSGSRLHLKSPQLQEASVRATVQALFLRQGVDAGRLGFSALSGRIDYLDEHRRIDIALDPFPYPGGATTADALWMGVPVLTLTGETFLGRQGVGLLANAGLIDWIASDRDDYVERAFLHSSDLSRLSALRGGLRHQLLASPLMDAPAFVGHLQGALRDVWRAHCARVRGGPTTPPNLG